MLDKTVRIVLGVFFLNYIFLAFLINEIGVEKLQEKVVEKQLMTQTFDKMGLTQNQLLKAVENIDEHAGLTFTALYDENLNLISKRSPSFKKGFDPLESEEFIRLVNTTSRGDMTMKFDPEEALPRKMYVHYHWFFTTNEQKPNVLMVTAISRYTVQTELSNLVLVFITFYMILTLYSVYGIIDLTKREQLKDIGGDSYAA